MNWSRRLLAFLLFLAVLSPLIATEKPLILIQDQAWRFPVLEKESVDWNQHLLQHPGMYDFILRAPVPWTPSRSDYANADFSGPFARQYYYDRAGIKSELPLRLRHLLGTDLRGTDVLSGIIHALRSTFYIGLFATLISAIIAFFNGIIAGWYAATGFKISRLSFWTLLILFGYGFIAVLNIRYVPELKITYLLIFSFCLLSYFIIRYYSKAATSENKITLPVDAMMTRMNELFSTFPRFILIVILGVFIQPSVTQVILLLGLTGWPDLSRVFRAEVLRLRDQPFMDAGRISGAGSVRLLFKHLLPNAWPVLSVTLLYTLSMNIMIEAGLGFIGIGLPESYVSLGAMMAQAKDHLHAWWLLVFPGLFLSISLFALYLLAESFRPSFDRN